MRFRCIYTDKTKQYRERHNPVAYIQLNKLK